MRALHFHETLRLDRDFPIPSPQPTEALIRTRLAGICNTDLEILRGYEGFAGVLGHEFVGEVIRADSAPWLAGRRVVGEINAYCGRCVTCRRGDTGHCPHRTVLGIHGRNGAMADYFTLPVPLLHPVPDSLDDKAAVFTEPLAAACRVSELVHIRPGHRVVVLGDGKLGLLIAQVLQLTGCDLLAVGRHPRKLAILAGRGIETRLASDPFEADADMVVEATGSATGFAMARSRVRPGGTLILKSTFRGEIPFDASGIVVDEITLLGSRCGPFPPALGLLAQGLIDVEPLIHGIFPLDHGLAAFEEAASGALKVLLST
uniref:Threonine dehydrogenase n=1 Tax=Candidatus Kentrum sp. SD TaxID=2126332 RepID=A0A451BIQ0_9GAMM|nr:MAG: Threonine dehydrogenase [Candidatus Kentron sp. SD]VFK46657.1 MAG: Threonine dehydrogenase [Candidatus Kentron sp. SD]VFK78170.1 MAG: Threonine dehydrogenase [Candidatus Kentron sp. SD]